MSDKTDVWMPIYVGDYLKDTGDLTLTEHGAYFKLLMSYWQKGCLEHCLEKCSRIAGAYTQAEREAVQSVVERFFIAEDGMLYNKRMTAELERAKAKRDAAQSKARKAAESRWNNASSNAPSIHQAMHEDMLGTCPSPSPSPSDRKAKALGRKRPSTRRPSDWTFNDKHAQQAAEKRVNVYAEAQRFMDWHDAKGSVFADWNAAFRTWLGRARPDAKAKFDPVAYINGQNRSAGNVIDADAHRVD